MDAIFPSFVGEGFGRGKGNLIMSVFLSLANRMFILALCLKDKTAFVCYNVTLVKISVDNENKTFVIVFQMTKFKIQAIRAE